MLRETEVVLTEGETVEIACCRPGVSEQRLRRGGRCEYGDMKVSQTHRLQELERESVRLRQAISNLTQEKTIRNEALS